MDSTVANDWRSWGGELETGLAKDHELGLEHNYLHRVKNIMLLYTHRDHIYGYNDFYACQIRGNFFPQNTSLAVLHFFFYMMTLPITLWAGYKTFRPKWFQSQNCVVAQSQTQVASSALHEPQRRKRRELEGHFHLSGNDRLLGLRG